MPRFSPLGSKHKATGRFSAGLPTFIVLIAFMLAILPAIGNAQSDVPDTRHYRIPPGPLEKALNQFASQTGIAISMDADQVKNLSTAGLEGAYNVEAGLATLLKNSGFTFEKNRAGYVLIPQAADTRSNNSATQVLPEIMIRSTEDENPYNRSYKGSKAFAGTKTDTPLITTPVSVQIVPRAVMTDQQAVTIKEALENVSGVRTEQTFGSSTGFLLRGFANNHKIYRNGLLATSPSSFENQFDTATLESIEVLKGPASMLFGRIEPGGLINLNSKRPLSTPFNAIVQQFGSYGHYRTEWDFTRPLDKNKSVLFRFDGSYQNSESFRNFSFTDRMVFHPSVTWRPSAATEITAEVEVLNHEFRPDLGIPVIGNRPAPVPISRSFGAPNAPVANNKKIHTGFNLTHHLNDSWKVNNRFLGTFAHAGNFLVNPPGFLVEGALLPDNRTLPRNIFGQVSDAQVFSTNLDLVGKIQFWQTKHEVLVGFDYLNARTNYTTFGNFSTPNPALAIDIFNPIVPDIDPALFAAARTENRRYNAMHEQFFGVYFQNHITLWNKLHILGGGRFDWAEVARGRSRLSLSDAADQIDTVTRKDQRFSPRVGILYQFIPWLGIYGNWTQSLGTNNGITAQGGAVPAQTAEQFEVGLKGELFDRRLTTTLTFYNLAKKNLLTPDLNTPDPLDSIAVGEQRSRGVELDMTGKITDELSFIGNYAYTDAKVTSDNSGLQGNRFANVPKHSGSLWLKYDFMKVEQLRGLSLGFGAFMVGQRNGDINNTFILPGYARLDAYARYAYRIGPTRSLIAQLNVRNLTDKRFYESADPFFNVAPRDSVYPGAPLTIVGSLRLEL
ncbi:MAG: TonB-dependent receptor [Nitrosomonas sp.]|uniref:TonB-dependent siderophore receptor n=1 Tax=Nitrosomonas sp. TaxID=42353 RepID=UPI0025EB18DC|nr:TonB-dependent receptor [Nitrosomonas sp.]UJP04135.1 MAG: TonB-dependent receptor [Nitrosomonas sp.]